MSEWVWSDMSIGGALNRQRLEEFQKVLYENMTDFQWNEKVDFASDSFPCNFGGMLRNADSDEITQFLMNHKLSYSIQIGGNGTDFLPEWRGWNPTLKHEIWKLTDSDGEVLMPERVVKELVLKVLRNKKLPRKKLMEKYFPQFTEIPPLTLIG